MYVCHKLDKYIEMIRVMNYSSHLSSALFINHCWTWAPPVSGTCISTGSFALLITCWPDGVVKSYNYVEFNFSWNDVDDSHGFSYINIQFLFTVPI